MINCCRIICLKRYYGVIVGNKYIKSDRILVVIEVEIEFCFLIKLRGMVWYSLGRNRFFYIVVFKLYYFFSFKD